MLDNALKLILENCQKLSRVKHCQIYFPLLSDLHGGYSVKLKLPCIREALDILLPGPYNSRMGNKQIPDNRYLPQFPVQSSFKIFNLLECGII